MSAIRTFNVEGGMPTLDEARRLVIEEIKLAKREGAKLLKVSIWTRRARTPNLRNAYGQKFPV